MARLNLEIQQGGTFTNEFFITDTKNGPLDLTGFTVKSEMRRSYGSITSAVELKTAIQDPVAGKVVMNLDSAVTKLIKAGRYVWDLEVTSPGNPDSVQAIEVFTEGSGYTTATVLISGGGGTGAAATAVITTGVITSITITSPGTGYTTDPLVTITGDGVDARLSAIRGSRVERILEGTVTVTPEVTKI